MIKQSTGSRGDHIDTVFQIVALFAITDAAVNDSDTKIGEPAVVAESSLDLRGEFSGRFQHKAAKIAVLRQKGEDWQSESGRFAGAGLRRADEVFAGEDDRKCAQLNRRRLLKAHRLCAMHYFIGKAEILE